MLIRLLQTYHAAFCECPKRLTMPWSRARVPSQITLFQETVLNQAIVEWNALFRILPQIFFFLNTDSAQDEAEHFLLCSCGVGQHHHTHCRHVTVGLPLLCCCVNSHPQKLPVTAQQMPCVYRSFSPYLAVGRSDWRFVFLDSGGEVNMKNFLFFKAANQNKMNFPMFFFCHWVALITLISLGNYRLI